MKSTPAIMALSLFVGLGFAVVGCEPASTVTFNVRIKYLSVSRR